MSGFVRIDVRPAADLRALLARRVAVVDRRPRALDAERVQRARLVLRERLGRVEVERAGARVAAQRVERRQLEAERLAARGAGRDDRRPRPGGVQRLGLVRPQPLDAARAQRLGDLGMQLVGQRDGARAARRFCAACMTSRSSSRPAASSSSQGSMSRTTAIPLRLDGCSAASTCDLDRTLRGAGGSFLHDADGAFTLLGARALEACDRRGAEVVVHSSEPAPRRSSRSRGCSASAPGSPTAASCSCSTARRWRRTASPTRSDATSGRAPASSQERSPSARARARGRRSARSGSPAPRSTTRCCGWSSRTATRADGRGARAGRALRSRRHHARGAANIRETSSLCAARAGAAPPRRRPSGGAARRSRAISYGAHPPQRRRVGVDRHRRARRPRACTRWMSAAVNVNDSPAPASPARPCRRRARAGPRAPRRPRRRPRRRRGRGRGSPCRGPPSSRSATTSTWSSRSSSS